MKIKRCERERIGGALVLYKKLGVRKGGLNCSNTEWNVKHLVNKLLTYKRMRVYQQCAYCIIGKALLTKLSGGIKLGERRGDQRVQESAPQLQCNIPLRPICTNLLSVEDLGKVNYVPEFDHPFIDLSPHMRQKGARSL